MNLEKIINTAMRSPLGTLVLIVILIYLLTVLIGMCQGCAAPRAKDVPWQQRTGPEWADKEAVNP